MDHITVVLVCYISECCNWEGMSYKIKECFKGKTTSLQLPGLSSAHSGTWPWVTVQPHPQILFRSCGQLWLQNKTWTEWPGNKASYLQKPNNNCMGQTYMQFLAARSLCTTLRSAKYSIPLAICRHMPRRTDWTWEICSVITIIPHYITFYVLEYSMSYTHVMQKSQIPLCTKLVPE